MSEDKYVYIGCNLYKVTAPNKNIKGAISLVNIMTREFLRHRDGVICDSQYEKDELFLYDSTFRIEIDSNGASFHCTNLGMQSHCIVNYFDDVIRIIDLENIKPYQDRYLFKLISEENIHVKDSLDIGNLNEQKLVVFGSSSSEIFDYIFGDNKNYLPFWASGWSARGLRNIDKHMKPYLDILNKISKESIILLHFGNADVDFNLSYKIIKEGFYYIPLFIEEMIDGIITLKSYLNKLGFSNIYHVFSAPPVHLPREYWVDLFNLDYIPPILRGRILWDYSVGLSSVIPVINCLPKLVESLDIPICSKEYTRVNFDHHLDFIKTQDLVYNELKRIKGMLPCRDIKHEYIYHHLICDVSFVVKNNKPRLRTCH